MSTVVCIGELLIDFVPTVTGTDLISAPAFKKAPGGAPANVAVGLARLGVASSFMGKVGDDPFGHFLTDTLVQAGVDASSVCYDKTARTALAFVSLKADGDREFMFYRHPSADMRFTIEEVDTATLREASIAHFGSVSLIDEPSRGATLHAVDVARSVGALVSYDANLRLPLWPSATAAREGLRLGVPRANIVKLSEEELEFLTGHTDPEAARGDLWHDELELLVVTHGAAGCTYVNRSSSASLAGFAVASIDTTGAGDGFVAGLLHGLLAHRGAFDDSPALQAICRFANAVGALTTMQRGAIPALPTLSAVQKFLDQV